MKIRNPRKEETYQSTYLLSSTQVQIIPVIVIIIIAVVAIVSVVVIVFAAILVEEATVKDDEIHVNRTLRPETVLGRFEPGRLSQKRKEYFLDW